MLGGDNNTLPEDSIPDLRGVVHRLQSFDRFLGQTGSTDWDEMVIAEHNQSLLDLHESCMLAANKPNTVPQQPVKHEGILETILAKPVVTPIVSKAKETLSSIQSATSSRTPAVLKGFPGFRQTNVDSKNEKEQEHFLHKTLFAIGEESNHKKIQLQPETLGRPTCSRDNKVSVSHKSTSPDSTSRNQKKVKEMSMNEENKTKVLKPEQEGQNVPKVVSSPRSISEAPHNQQQQQRGEKADPLSLSLHRGEYASRMTSSSKRPHSRQGLYCSLGRRSEHGERRMTKSKPQDVLASRSDHVSTSRAKMRMALERKSSLGIVTSSSTLNKGEEEDDRGPSRSPSCQRPRHARRPRTISPKREVDLSSGDCHDEKKGRSHRSHHSSRKPASEILRARSSQTSPQSRRAKKPSSSGDLLANGEQPLTSRRSRSSEDIAHQTSRDQRTSRRRLKMSRGSQGEFNEQTRNETMKQRDSIKSFFGTHGGSGIITNTLATQVKRLCSAGELSSNASLHDATPAWTETKPAITQKTMNHLMLDLRRQTGRNLIQKFKSTRDLKAGIMDDILA